MANSVIKNTADKLVIESGAKRVTFSKRRYDRPVKWTLDISTATPDSATKIYLNYDMVEVLEAWLEAP